MRIVARQSLWSFLKLREAVCAGKDPPFQIFQFFNRTVNLRITLVLVIFALLFTPSLAIGNCCPQKCKTISDHARSEFPSADLFERKDFHPRTCNNKNNSEY